MLAQPGQPFDSEEHLFEIKWDGTRAQARIEGGRARLTNRRRRGLTGRYPELEFLGEYGDGFLLDGEIVVLHDGKPDFSRLLTREQAQSTLKIAGLAKSMPATYIGLISCTGTGKRSGSWLKIKRTQEIQCAILGFVATGDTLRSLIIAADVDGQLRCVGKVGSGISTAMGNRLMELLGPRRWPEPWLECKIDGQWVGPGSYCVVAYLELTRAGHLRALVFRSLLVGE